MGQYPCSTWVLTHVLQGADPCTTGVKTHVLQGYWPRYYMGHNETGMYYMCQDPCSTWDELPVVHQSCQVASWSRCDCQSMWLNLSRWPPAAVKRDFLVAPFLPWLWPPPACSAMLTLTVLAFLGWTCGSWPLLLLLSRFRWPMTPVQLEVPQEHGVLSDHP